MKKTNIFIFLLIMLAMVVTVQAQEPQYESVSIMAEDVNCRECHATSPHEIHAGKPVNCQSCHGEALSIAIPQCSQCHTGQIHQVHINKVRTEDCSFCHKAIDTFHDDMISTTLCAHCHKDLINVHGGPKVGCEKCHATAPDIVKPLKAAQTTVICQNCHISADIVDLHGGEDNRTACYRCHRPGSTDIEASSEIPHFLHIPNVDCNNCHLSQETGKIYIPQCTQCHSVGKLHAFKNIGLKTASTGLKCGVCHPTAAADVTAKADGAPATTKTPAAKTPTTEEPSGIPGFGVILAFVSLAVIYLAKRK